MRTQLQRLCRDCNVSLADDSKYLCPDCIVKHHAAWKEEHTRKPGDMRKEWLIGDKCRVTLRKVEYIARIIDMSDISRRENNYDWVRLELSRTERGFGNELITQTWIHPEPVQSYKLKKLLLK